MNRPSRQIASRATWLLVLAPLSGCGGKQVEVNALAPTAAVAAPAGDGGIDDRSRCEYKGRPDREATETAGPGAVQPNVRRVYQIVGSGDTAHKVLLCREVDTNLDGIKDVVRIYNEKGESIREEADANYDGRVDTWITFSGGRIVKEELDSDFDGKVDVWKYYVGGQLSRIQRDTNHDGKPDRWEFYSNCKLERMGLDLDFDGHVDRWDHDEAARLAEQEGEANHAASSAAAQADAGSPAAKDDGGGSAAGARARKR
jgi:hypothetical protein